MLVDKKSKYDGNICLQRFKIMVLQVSSHINKDKIRLIKRKKNRQMDRQTMTKKCTYTQKDKQIDIRKHIWKDVETQRRRDR